MVPAPTQYVADANAVVGRSVGRLRHQENRRRRHPREPPELLELSNGGPSWGGPCSAIQHHWQDSPRLITLTMRSTSNLRAAVPSSARVRVSPRLGPFPPFPPRSQPRLARSAGNARRS